MKFDKAPQVDLLQIPMTVEKVGKLNNWIDRHKTNMELARKPFMDRHKQFLYNWDDFVTFTRKGPWENSSNLHMPLTAIMVKTYHSRLYNLFSDEATTTLLPRDQYDRHYCDMIRKLRKWYLWDYLNGYKGIRGFVREVFYDAVTVGFGIGMKDWWVDVRKVIDIDVNELSKETKDLQGNISDAQQGSQELQTQEEEANAKVSTAPYKEVEKILTIFEGTRLRSIPFENVFFPNDIPESNDLDHPLLVMLESEFTVSDVMLKGARGEWKNAEEVKREGMVSYTGMDQQQIKQIKENLSGINSIQSLYDQDRRIVQYCFAKYDIDEDGIDESIIVTRSSKGVILKIDYLDRLTKTGMRPIFKFDCFTKPRQGYSRGVPEFMYPLNEEMDMHHNMRVDYMALQTCPFGVYRASSSLKSEPIRISPGKFIPVDETSDMRVLNFQSNSSMIRSEEDLLWTYAERLTAVSSLMQGIVPEQVGPTRSTSGVVTLLQQMEKEFKVTIDQCAQQWKKLEKMIIEDLDLRISPMIKMRVLGTSIQDFLPAEVPSISKILQLNAMFDIDLDVANLVHSDEVRRTEADMLLQKMVAPSLLQQSGIVTPKAMFKAMSEYLQAFGRDPDDYIDEPQFVGKALTLYQEVQVCGQGEIPPMSMQDDHMMKAQHLAAFAESPEFQEALQKGIYQVVAVDFIQRAIQKHLQLAQALQPQGLPNPSGGGNTNVVNIMGGQGGRSGRSTPGNPNGAQAPAPVQPAAVAGGGGAGGAAPQPVAGPPSQNGG